MEEFSTKDIVSEVINESMEQIGGVPINDEAYSRLLDLCILVDGLGENSFGEAETSAEIYEGNVLIYIDVDEIVLRESDIWFWGNIESVDFLTFSKLKTDLLRIGFGINNLWMMPYE